MKVIINASVVITNVTRYGTIGPKQWIIINSSYHIMCMWDYPNTTTCTIPGNGTYYISGGNSDDSDYQRRYSGGFSAPNNNGNTYTSYWGKAYFTPCNYTVGGSCTYGGIGSSEASIVKGFSIQGVTTETNYTVEQWVSVNTTVNQTHVRYAVKGIIYSALALTNSNVSLFINNTYIGNSTLAIVANNFTKHNYADYIIPRDYASANLKIELRLNSSEFNNTDTSYIPYTSNSTTGGSSSCVVNLVNAYVRPHSCTVFP
jgi:hypothetical protein